MNRCTGKLAPCTLDRNPVRGTAILKDGLVIGLHVATQHGRYLLVNPRARKKRNYSKTSLDAGDRLLMAVKQKLLREKGSIDYSGLRGRGYCEALLSRLKAL